VDVRLEADEALRLPPEVEQNLYWIAQEALNNALKHAGATSLGVSLRRAGSSLELEIVDDGQGFAPGSTDLAGGIGLESVRERTQQIRGKLDIYSEPGQGTRLRIELPGLFESESSG
jgi:signal transduction histidine kinase